MDMEGQGEDEGEEQYDQEADHGEQQIIDEELGEEMREYAHSNSFDSWHKCINILPEIADLVNCLKQEADLAEGKFPLN